VLDASGARISAALGITLAHARSATLVWMVFQRQPSVGLDVLVKLEDALGCIWKHGVREPRRGYKHAACIEPQGFAPGGTWTLGGHQKRRRT
jgi:hypothetical protein